MHGEFLMRYIDDQKGGLSESSRVFKEERGMHHLLRIKQYSFVMVLVLFSNVVVAQNAATSVPQHDGKPADMSQPVQVFICLGQSNMVGLGKVKGGENSLEYTVKQKQKYSYLVGSDGDWIKRADVRFVQYMSGKGPLKNEWLGVSGNTLGPEYGIGHLVGNRIDAPVMVLKCCIGNRSLGWDLLPPGSQRYSFIVEDKNGKPPRHLVYAGYKDRPESWELDPGLGLETQPGPWLDKNGNPIDWYAGKQWDYDIGDAKRVLADLERHYPGAKGYKVAGFFFWQGEKDAGNAGHADRYEQNLVYLIKALRKEFDSPDAKFVLATMGESVKGQGGNGGKVLDAHLAVDGRSGKYPEFQGNVATVYTHPLAQGGSGNGHYGGKAEVYMDVGELMGQAMVELLDASK